MSYAANPPCRTSGKTKIPIPWKEYLATVLGEKKAKDTFKKGDGIKTAERIIKKMAKRGSVRRATKEELKKIKERNERRAKNR